MENLERSDIVFVSPGVGVSCVLSNVPPLVRSGLLPGKYLLSGRSGDTGKAGVAGGVSWELIMRRRPTRGLGGTAAAAHRGPRPIKGLVGCEGGASRLVLAGTRRCRAGLGGVLVATVRCSMLGLPGTLCTPTTFTWAPPEGEVARPGGPRLQLSKHKHLHHMMPATADTAAFV